ncbi:ADYC domain-containing protein [Sorangium sp. So ce1000]|uniref:ADYC domain-containing protein n=1 Tax=Sorangium sp. So ce1000 TaxID=3133325 RepID=UPI003F5DD0DC
MSTRIAVLGSVVAITLAAAGVVVVEHFNDKENDRGQRAVGGDQPEAGGGQPEADGGQPDPRTMTLAMLCPKVDREEHGGLQSRLVRGGCLEHFPYVIAEREGERVSPPDVLPSVVKGFHFPSGNEIELHVTTSKTDDCIKDASGRSIDAPPLYDVWVTTSDKGEYNLCSGVKYNVDSERCPNEASALEGKAFAVPGYWGRENGGLHASSVVGRSVITLACISGVAAKCVHWGYVPWAKYPEGTGTELADHHKACVSAARARYLDDDRSYTCGDTLVDTVDQLGIRQKDTSSRGANFTFESLWGGGGELVCMNHLRYERCEGLMTAIDNIGKHCAEDYGPDEPWPPGAMLMVRSEPGKVAPSGTCPETPALCVAAQLPQ